MSPQRIFVVGMAGAGNLGDDLISTCLCGHLRREWPNARIGVLMHEYSHPLVYPPQVTLFPAPQWHAWSTMRARRHAIREFLNSAELLVVGGGGLLQDIHFPFNVYNWLCYSTACDRSRCGRWGVGLGAGPIRYRHTTMYLRQTLPAFDVVQVRDQHSAELLQSMGIRTVPGPDIVAGSDVSEYGFHATAQDNAIGCSLRQWPGLKADAIVELLAELAKQESSTVRFFTFEYYEPDNASDYELHCLLGTKLAARGVKVEQFCYRKTQWEEFCHAFSSVRCAIAMRLHANVLWQKVNVPVLPVAYSPKVSSLYADGDGARSVLRVEDIGGIRANARFERITNLPDYKLPTESDAATHEACDPLRAVVANTVCAVANFAFRTSAGLWRRFAHAAPSR